MIANAFVRARIDEHLKNEAAEVLANMGLTVSDLVRITLTRVAKEKALPFDLSIPNAETRAAMEESRTMIKTRQARFNTGSALIENLNEEASK